jgi:hypothetical protein
MAEWSYSAIDQVQTPGGNIPVNTGSGDHFFIDAGRSTGLGVSDIRGSDDERGQDDGLLLHPRFLGGQQIALLAIALILSASTDAGYLTARDTFLTDVRTKLKTAINADGALHFAGGQSIAVRTRAIGPPQSEDALGRATKSMLVVLVSATPA